MAASPDVPPMDAFTRPEWRIIRRCRSPERVHRFLRSLPYNWERGGDTLRSFRQVIRRETAQCLEAALVTAVSKEQHAEQQRVGRFDGRARNMHFLSVCRLSRHRSRTTTACFSIV